MTCRIALTLLSLVLAPAALAQTGPELLIAQWGDDSSFELEASVMLLADGEAESGGTTADADLRLYDLGARYRPHADEDRPLAFGAEFTYIDLGPWGTRLVDQAVAVGARVGAFDDWAVDVIAGVGYAGNNPFADGNAIYFRADLMFSKQLDDRSALRIILDYNGNRSIFPDIPLPAIAYSRKVSDQFNYTVGLPVSTLWWEPAENVTVELVYNLPVTLDVLVRWQAVEDFALFAGFHNRFDAFFIDGLPDTRRWFFRQRSIEAGVAWTPRESIEIGAAIGYAFSQEIEVGFDVRDTDRVAEFSDEPFVRLTADIGF